MKPRGGGSPTTPGGKSSSTQNGPSTPQSSSHHSFIQTTPLVIPKGTPPSSAGYVVKKSYDWISYFASLKSKTGEGADQLKCVPVSSFKHAPLSDVFDDLVSLGLKVEVKNNDCSANNGYWIATVVKFRGYLVQLRYEGFDNSSKDFWINIFNPAVHPVGWCASQGHTLIPPTSIASQHTDWKGFLLKRLTGSRTFPANFQDQLKEALKTRFTPGMKLEVVDKHRIAAVRVAVIDQIIGGRLHVQYEADSDDDNGFWCHQYSPLIHPVGWAQLVGHELIASHDYAKESVYKAINDCFDPHDANWTLFPPIRGPPALQSVNNIVNGTISGTSTQSFREGMKLEAIDPLNLSTICVGTVAKVLRSNYLMIGIDGMMSPDGSDWFCYHASSPCIFPVGFCKFNNIPLTPPRDWEGEFDWATYLKETNSIAAPVALFKKDNPNHQFKEGYMLEAVDLMEPRLVCVATIAKAVGRLIKIHFNGWDESYDQWCDCESPELFPVGWCDLVGYPLEPPNSDSTVGGKSRNDGKRKKSMYRGGKKRKPKTSSSSKGKDVFNTTASSTTSSVFEESLMEEDQVSENDVTFLDSRPPTEPARKIIRPDITAASPASITPPTTSSRIRPSTSSTSSTANAHQHSQSSSSHLSNSSVVVKPSPAEPVTPNSLFGRVRDADPKNWSVTDVVSFMRENKEDKCTNAIIARVSSVSFQYGHY